MKSFISKLLKIIFIIAALVVLIHGMTPALYAHAEAVNSLQDSEQSQVLAAVSPAGSRGELWPEAVKVWKTGPVLGMDDQSPTTIPELVPGAARAPETIYQTSESQGVKLSVPKNIIVVSKVIPDKVSFPLMISASEPGMSVEVNEINVMSGNQLLLKITASPPVNTLDDKYFTGGQNIIPKNLSDINLAVPLTGLPVVQGQPLELVTTVKAVYKGQMVQLTVVGTLTIASLPALKNWYCGDGHMHSNFYSPGSRVADDGLLPPADVIKTMSTIGYQWVIMTAHKGAIDSQTAWKNYWATCDKLQADCGMPVCPGIEISTNSNAHALAYGQRPSKMPPHSQSLSESQLLKAIAGQNPGISFGGQAHPSGYYFWKSWPSGSRLAELLSGETAADCKNYQLWLDYLKRNLSNTLRTGVFCAGVGNSDFHTGKPVGCTWLYSTSYASNQRDPIWAALKAGRLSASGRGDFGAFAVNGYMPGSVLRKPVSLTCTVIQQPISGAHCEAFVIRDANGENIWQSPLHPPAATNIAIPLPAGDTFYHVYFIFSDDNSGEVKSDVITSPVFIDR